MRNPGSVGAMSIAEVAKATSAAPGYFAPVTIDDLKVSDGGIGVNNPSLEAYREVMFMHAQRSRTSRADRLSKPSANDQTQDAIDLFISIGTGKKPRFVGKKGVFASIEVIQRALYLMTDTESAHEEVLSRRPRDYYRYQVPDILGEMKLDEWKPRHTRGKIKSGSSTLRRITELTNKYLAQNETVSRLQECARSLVRLRRSRPSLKTKSDPRPKPVDDDKLSSSALDLNSSPPAMTPTTHPSKAGETARISNPLSSISSGSRSPPPPAAISHPLRFEASGTGITSDALSSTAQECDLAPPATMPDRHPSEAQDIAPISHPLISVLPDPSSPHLRAMGPISSTVPTSNVSPSASVPSSLDSSDSTVSNTPPSILFRSAEGRSKEGVQSSSKTPDSTS